MRAPLPVAIAPTAFLLTIVCLTSCSDYPAKSDVAAAKAEGNIIIQQVKLYISEHGSEPKSLESLVPAYFDQEFANSMKYDWRYALRDEGGFVLSHEWGIDGPVLYSYGDSWSLDTK